MTRGAWIMLLSVWSVVIVFSAYYLWRVFTLPQRDDNQSES